MRTRLLFALLFASGLIGCDSVSPLTDPEHAAPERLVVAPTEAALSHWETDDAPPSAGIDALDSPRGCDTCTDQPRGRLRLDAAQGHQFILKRSDGARTKTESYVLKLEQRASRRATLGVYRLTTKRKLCDSDRTVEARLVRRVILRLGRHTTIPELSTTVYWPSAAMPGLTISYRTEVDPVPGTDPRPVPEPPVGSVFICPTISELVIVH